MDLGEALSAGTSLPALFVLSASYFDANRLRAAEREVRRAHGSPRSLEPCHDLLDVRGSFEELKSAFIRWLDAGTTRSERSIRELRLVKTLDVKLGKWSIDAILDGRRHVGCDGLEYWLCPRNAPIKDLVGSQMSGTTELHDYCVHFGIVPCSPVEGVHVVPISRKAWCTDPLDRRLREALEDEGLAFLVHPFERVKLEPLRADAVRPDGVRIIRTTNQEELCVQIESAVRRAEKERAAVLVFPELTFGETMLDCLVARLGARAKSEPPYLTVAGLCHRPAPGASLAFNEAILLGPRGDVLRRHQKIACHNWEEEGRSWTEATEAGSTFEILESAIGNVALAICRDLFAVSPRAALAKSHANVLLVPSMGDKIAPHAAAAELFKRSNFALTAVCNQRLEAEASDENAWSFVTLPRGTDDRKNAGPEQTLLVNLSTVLEEDARSRM